MRLFRGRLAQACVYFGRNSDLLAGSRVGWPELGAITGSAGHAGRLTGTGCNNRICWPELGAITGWPVVGWPKHASAHLFRGRLAQAMRPGSVGPGMRLFRGRDDRSMRLFRGRLTHGMRSGRLTGACVYPAGTAACVYFGWPEHASISASDDRSMRLFPLRMTGACVYFRLGWPEHASISASDDRSMRLSELAAGVIGAGFALPRDAGQRPALQALAAVGSTRFATALERGAGVKGGGLCGRNPHDRVGPFTPTA